MLNRFSAIGRVVRDPELRRTSEAPCATFTIACDRDYGKGTDFLDVVCWRNTAEFVDRNITKGRLVAISGRLQIRTWQDHDGNKRKAAETVADNVYPLDKREQDASASAAGDPPQGEGFYEPDENDGHLPF